MKKGLFSLLCIILTVIYIATGLAATTYTLPEKMEKQLSIGSGLKGSFTLYAEGNDPIVLALDPFLNIPLQMRGMRSEQDLHYYIYQAGEDETQKGLTEFYFHEDRLYFRSDLLPDRVFSLPPLTDLADLLTAKEDTNPSFSSMLIRYFNLPAEQKTAVWDPYVEKLAQKIELWISGFMVSNSLKTQKQGNSVVQQNYTIPMSELKKEILVLLREARSDPEAHALLESLMNSKQKKVYLNKYLDYFYQEAMDALQDDFDVVLSRTISTMGEEISSYIELPLDQSRFGYSSIVISSRDGNFSCTLKNDIQTLFLITEDNVTDEEFHGFTFWMMSWPENDEGDDKDRHAVRVEIKKTSETSTDEDTRDHQKDHWSLRVENDLSMLPESEAEKQYTAIIPISADVTLHYYSKYSQSSPTTLEINAAFERENLKIGLEGSWKTASPWIFSPFDISDAENFMTLSDEQKLICLAEWLASAGEQLENPSEEETQPENAAEEIPGDEEASNAAESGENSPEDEESEETGNNEAQTTADENEKPEEDTSTETETPDEGDMNSGEETNPEAELPTDGDDCQEEESSPETGGTQV